MIQIDDKIKENIEESKFVSKPVDVLEVSQQNLLGRSRNYIR